MDTIDVDVVTIFSEEMTEGGCVTAVPGNFVFRQKIAHSALVVIGVVVVIQRWGGIPIIISGRRVIVAVVVIAGHVAGVIERIGISIESIWVGAIPPRAPPPWRGEVADKDDLVEMLEAMKPSIPSKFPIMEVVKTPKTRR
jgi:hypothetical protein